MHAAQLPGPLAARAARLHELAGLVELHDARVAQAVRHQNRSVRQERDILRHPEMCRVIAGDAGLADRHDQLLAVVGELVDDVLAVVDDPHVLLGIVRADADLVRAPPPSNSESHCVHDSITLPARSTTIRQLRISALGSVARCPVDPQIR